MIVKIGKYYYTENYLFKGAAAAAAFILLGVIAVSMFFTLTNLVLVAGVAILIYVVLLGLILGDATVPRSQEKQKLLKEKYELLNKKESE